MTTNISPDGSTTIPQPSDRSGYRTPNDNSSSPSLSDPSYRATNYQHSASDYMDALRTTMATIASVIDFYDPSGVLNSAWNLSAPSENVDGSQTDATPAQEHTSSLFSSSEAPTSPPGLDSTDRQSRDLSDNEILSLTQTLKDEEASRRPLVSATVPLSVLQSEYASPIVRAKIDWLSANGWTGLRRSRGDGDCFYRSMAFAYVERIMDALDQSYAAAASLSTIEGSLEDLKLVGFEPIVFEDFFEVLKELILNIVQPDIHNRYMSHLALLERFQDPYISNSVVVFFRLLASAYIRLHADDFVPFLFDPETFEPIEITRFCETQVEATGREADHPQIQALTRALKVAVDIAYVDGNTAGVSHGGAGNNGPPDGQVDFVRFETEGSDGANPITLLYRPGHYDILEKKSSVPTETFAR